MDFADSLHVLEIASKLTADIEQLATQMISFGYTDGENGSHFFYFHSLTW